MAYIKVPLTYYSFPKIKKYIQLSKDSMAALPLAASILAAKESPRDAHMVMPPALLETECHWNGRRGLGVQSLIGAGILEKTDDGFRFLGWDDGWTNEQGHIVKFKERAAKAARALWNGSTDDATSNA